MYDFPFVNASTLLSSMSKPVTRKPAPSTKELSGSHIAETDNSNLSFVAEEPRFKLLGKRSRGGTDP